MKKLLKVIITIKMKERMKLRKESGKRKEARKFKKK